jgi:hypothetical protein
MVPKDMVMEAVIREEEGMTVTGKEIMRRTIEEYYSSEAATVFTGIFYQIMTPCVI